MKESENFNVSLSIHGFSELKSRIHVISSRHSRIFIDDKIIGMIDEDQEQRFRGSISLSINDCIIGIVSVYFSMMMKCYMVSYDYE